MHEADFDGSSAFDPGRLLPLADLWACAPSPPGGCALQGGRPRPACPAGRVECGVLLDLQAALPAALEVPLPAEAERLVAAIRGATRKEAGDGEGAACGHTLTRWGEVPILPFALGTVPTGKAPGRTHRKGGWPSG
ncbi:hypothetical protein [Deinococcus hopiensis]|uniref:hypothetical protein n=1 Tax=Deinococcus hopiensis TaxID=309885 RepID=UPI00111BD2FB|nr:hypothetical protein [Deinococcus hopiensis]